MNFIFYTDGIFYGIRATNREPDGFEVFAEADLDERFYEFCHQDAMDHSILNYGPCRKGHEPPRKPSED